MTLTAFKDWLKSKVDVGDGIEVGGVNAGKERFIGVYAREGDTQQRVCLGGLGNTCLQYKRVAVFIRWGKSPAAAEQKAMEVHEAMQDCYGELIGGCKVVRIDPGEAPIPLGRDLRGISEWGINATISYERKAE